MSETAKHAHLVQSFVLGNGCDLGSSGNPVVPWAIQVDLPTDDYLRYNPTRPETAIHWKGNAADLPFKDGTLDFVHASHLLEDFADWSVPLNEWTRVLKVGGFLLIAVPDHERFRAYVERGRQAGIDCDNLNHKHESHVGELSELLQHHYITIRDGFVSDNPQEYSILYIGMRRAG